MSSAAVPRFALHIYKDIVGTKSIFSTFSSNRVLSINKLLLANEAVRYLDYSEVTQQKVLCYSNMSVTHVGEKQYSMETIVLAFEYFASSRTVHNLLREDIQLPSLRTLTWLTSKVRGLVDNVYANNIFLNLLTFFLLASCCYMKFMSLWLYSTTVVSYLVRKLAKHLLSYTMFSSMLVTLYAGSTFLWKMLPVKELHAKFLALLLMQLNALKEI